MATYTDKNFTQVANATLSDAYTAPANTTVQVLSIIACNVGTTFQTLKVNMTDTSKSTDFTLANVAIFPGNQINIVSKLLLETGDKIRIQSTDANSIVVVGSVSERT